MPATLSNHVTIKPDMRIVHPELGDITEDVARELAAETHRDDLRLAAEAEARQALLAASAPGEARVTPGFALKARIDPQVHAYWLRREGPGFWKHELDFMLKRHPELRVRARPDNPTVLVDGFRGTAAAARPATAPRRGGRWHSH